MKKIIFCVIALSKCIMLCAQQDPVYAQFLLNPVVVNPAYAGIGNNLNVNTAYRSQWTGLEGQPQTLNVNATISLSNNRIGTGVLVVQDKAGSLTNTEFDALLSYKMNLGDNKVLSFGMQAGAVNIQNNYAALSPYDVDDPAFTGVDNTTQLNIGAGLLLKSNKWIAGLSVPRMLPSTLKNGNQSFDLYSQHLYAFGGYSHNLNDHIQLKPSTLLRYVKNAPLSVDVVMNVTFHQMHSVGIFTRNLNTYGVLLQTLLLDKYKIGYVFEMPSGELAGNNFTTHEISVGLLLKTFKFHETPAGL